MELNEFSDEILLRMCSFLSKDDLIAIIWQVSQR